MGESAERAPEFLVHNEGDQVAVAVRDVEAGRVRAVYLDSDREIELEAAEAIPLGHKIALADVDAGAGLMEYGVVIGRARSPIPRGALVHTHNLRSARWEASA